ncbi:hypothetical protein V6N13_090591 [Hibiscus sabdariffa]
MESNSWLLILFLLSTLLFSHATNTVAVAPVEPISVSSVHKLHRHGSPFKFRLVSKKDIDQQSPPPPPQENDLYHNDFPINGRDRR